MEFFDKLVLPHSGTNLELLKYLLILANVIFGIFSGVLFGSSLLSFIFRLRANKTRNENYTRLSIDYIDLITASKTMGFGLGIVPFFAIITIYVQLLYKSGANVIPFLLAGFAFYLVAIVWIYSYKHSIHLTRIFSRIKKEEAKDEVASDIEEYVESTAKLGSKTTLWGVLFLFISLWIFFASSVHAVDKLKWHTAGTILDVMFSVEGIFKLLHFLTSGMALTGIAFIVKYYFWDKHTYNPPQEYSEYSKKVNLWIALGFTALQPFFFAFITLVTPSYSVTPFIFGLIVFILCLAFVVLHLIYISLKEKKYKTVVFSFYILITIFALIIVKEQTALGISIKEQMLKLSDEYDKAELARLEAEGKNVAEKINGEEIYKAKCTACHKLNEKFVGPPHKLVLIKYQNDKEAMVKYILNPYKVDPAYGLMPAQGLKPNEAKAVVDYMYEHYANEIK